MTNEIPIEQKETNIDDSSFDKESKTRVLEMSLIAYRRSEVSFANDDIRAEKIQAPFSTIVKNDIVVNDNEVVY